MDRREIDSAVCSDVGKKRKANEDSTLMLAEAGIFCIADGMGGVEGGAVASQQTLKMVADLLGADPRVLSYAEKTKRIKQALLNANRWIRSWAASRGNKGCGTTFVGLVLDFSGRGRTSFFHAGDSRGYRFRQGVLKQITRDHSVATAFGDQNMESLPAMFKNVIMNAIGAQETFSLEPTPVSAEPGDLFLLCSDGLTCMLPDPRIAELLAGHAEAGLNATAQALVQAANDAGGVDNTSVLLVRILAPLQSDPDDEEAGATDTHDAMPLTHLMPVEAEVAPSAPSTEDSEMLARTPHDDEAPTADHPLAPRKRRFFLSLAAAGILLAAAAALLLLPAREETPAPPPPSPPAVATPAAPTPSTAPTPSPAPVALQAALPALTEEELSALVEDHIESGRLGELEEFLRQDPARMEHLQASRKDYDAFRGWFSEWSRSAANPDAVPSEVQSYQETIQPLFSLLGMGDSDASALSWPDSASERATLKCRLKHQEQNKLVEASFAFMAQWETEAATLGRNPERTLEILEAASTRTGLTAANNALKSGMADFRRWLERSRARPISADDWERVARPFVNGLQQNMSLLRSEVWSCLLALSPESVRRVAPSDMVPVVLEIKRRNLAALSTLDSESVWADESSRMRMQNVIQYLSSVATPAGDRTEAAP